MPMPTAASTTSAGTWVRPTTVFLRTGSSEYRDRAATDGAVPSPSGATKKPNRARLGTVKSTPANPTAAAATRGRENVAVPSSTAAGTAMRSARATSRACSPPCSQSTSRWSER